MNEPSFTNREIDAKLAIQSEDLKSHMDKALAPILIQTTYTNGRVKKLYLYFTVLGSVTITLLFTSDSDLARFILQLVF